jgi:hypothetical protein
MVPDPNTTSLMWVIADTNDASTEIFGVWWTRI